MDDLLDRRLVFVTGKGGVGKTTVAAALGLAAARAGKRTIVCEVAGQQRLAGIFGTGDLGYEETELAEGLHGISIEPEQAKEEWLRYQLRSGALAGILGHSRIFQLLTAAAPGLSELVTIGKIWELAQLQRKKARSAPYDLTIVDSPATGHGLAMLRAPKTFADVARVGPIHKQAMIIHSFIADHRTTGVLVVALPEEMPVNETLDFGRRLDDEMAMAMDGVVVNALLPDRFSGEEASALENVDLAAARVALAEHRRARAQRSQLRRLKKDVDASVATLPYLFAPELGHDEVDQLSKALERKL